MKRSLYAFLCAMLMCCALLFVACGDDDTTAGTTPPKPSNSHTHTWGEPTCTADRKCTTCGERDAGTALGHSIITVEAKPANCTEGGLSEGEKCERCNAWVKEQVSEGLPLGHVDADPADKVCDVCKETICEHEFDYTAGWDFGNSTHWRIPTCGCNVRGDEASHEYDEDEIVCIVCGYDTEKNDHYHEQSDKWSYDSAEHWHAASCGHGWASSLAEPHEDADGNEVCDVCKAPLVVEYNMNLKYETYNWNKTDIVVCFNENSNIYELSSELRRYLAGTESKYNDRVDEYVRTRNESALKTTNVNVLYTYWGEGDSDIAGAGWSKTITRMIEQVMANAPGSPDIYCNFMYDMISASLQKAFANLRTTKLSGGDNNFSFMEDEFNAYADAYGQEWGYMMEYMSELGFSVKKQYLLASDYFIDLVRAFFVVPMNLNLLKTIDVSESTGDLNNDGNFDVDDFYSMVTSGQWTYDVLAQYCNAVYKNTSGVLGGSFSDTNGIVLVRHGLVSSGILYTSSVELFKRTENEATGFFECTYPSTNEDLFNFCDALSELVNSVGVYVPEKALPVDVRDYFTSNKMLFGGIILLGSLEYQAYQDMKKGDGFGILPVPVYKEGDSYRTLIHNVGRIAAISANTTKFAQCSAFLDYQSTHSTEVLNEYYNYKLQMDVADGSAGNIAILQYIRKNVRSGFDKAYDDAIGYYFGNDTDYGNSWAGIINEAGYKVSDMRSLYVSNSGARDKAIKEIVAAYEDLPA